MINKRKVGSDKEQLAARYLTDAGYRIIESNYYCNFGEIDLIAEEDGYLCFIEVKYRADAADGYPEEAVDLRKIRRISRSAVAYMHMCGYSEDTPCRFDVVTVLGDEVSVIRNAFDALL